MTNKYIVKMRNKYILKPDSWPTKLTFVNCLEVTRFVMHKTEHHKPKFLFTIFQSI